MPAPSLLLDADEPAPVRLLRPEGGSDFVLTVDHAGRLLPRRLGTLGVPDSELARHIGWDIGIAAVSERLSAALDAPAVMQLYSRLAIDCNRSHGVDSSVPAISESTPIPGNLDLTADDLAARRQGLFVPYHAAIASVLDARLAAGRRSVVVAMHSFTPVFKGVPRPMHVGVLFNRDPRLGRALLALLQREPGLVCAENQPYAVSDATDYGIPTYGEQRGLLHVEMEIRQDLITEAAGQAEWAERLARLLPLAAAAVQ